MEFKRQEIKTRGLILIILHLSVLSHQCRANALVHCGHKLCTCSLSWYLHEWVIIMFFFLFLFNGGDIITFFSPLSFCSAAMTMQFISHRFPDYHDPTIGEYRFFSPLPLAVSLPVGDVRQWEAASKRLLERSKIFKL